MTRGEFAEYLGKLQEKEGSIREIAQKEYAHDEENAFANFERTAADLGLTREQVLWIFLKKHLDGILAHIRGFEAQREGIQGRIHDARLYLALLGGMFEESSGGEP